MRKGRSRIVYKIILILSAMMLATGAYVSYSSQSVALDYDSLTIAKVESGDFITKIDGYGTLQSLSKRLLTATSNAIVDRIDIKPGAKVKHDSVILKLKNINLVSELRKASSALKNAKTQRRKISLQQQREIISQESEIAQVKADRDIARLQVNAESELVKSGIISRLTSMRSKLKSKQLEERYRLARSKFEKLLTLHEEALATQDDLISQAEEDLKFVRMRVDQLAVRAGMDGVLQRLSVSLGQAVSMGDELALIGSLTPLIAEVQIPQLQAHLIREGMIAKINTVSGEKNGAVTRIDPVVTDGAVRVDIRLDTDADSSAIKPMQMVDVSITSKAAEGVSLIKTPAGVTEGRKLALFKLDGNNQAHKVEVSFGKETGQQIQVLSGLKVGDAIIISKMELPENIQQIEIRR